MRTADPISVPKARSRLCTFALIVGTLLVMGRLCFNDFTWWDDNLTVHHNPMLNPPTFATIGFYFTHSAYRIYAPLTYAVWSGIALIAKVNTDRDGISLNPWLFHTANVLLHLIAAITVLRILQTLGCKPFASLCGALVFAIHPVQVEAVAWVSGLKDVLSGLLALIALWQYLCFARKAANADRSRTPLLLAIITFLLAMLAKTSAASLPLAALAIDRWIVGRSWRSVLASSGLLALLALPFALITIHTHVLGDFTPIPLWRRPFIACDSLSFYFGKLIWPTNLCIDYGRTPAVIHIVFLLPLAIGIALLPARFRIYRAAYLIFIAGCLPTLGLFMFSMQFFSGVADHYLYWAMLGPAIAVGTFLNATASTLMRAIVCVIFLFFAALSFHQGGFWKDDFTLCTHTIAINPNSFLAFNNLGNAFNRRAKPAIAADNFRRAIKVNPTYALAHSNLAAALHELGQNDQAILELHRSIDLQSQLPPRLRQTWEIDHNRLNQISHYPLPTINPTS